VRPGGLAGFSRSGVVDGDDSEFPLAVLGEVRHGELLSCDRRRVDRHPVTSGTTFCHRRFLDHVTCKYTADTGAPAT